MQEIEQSVSSLMLKTLDFIEEHKNNDVIQKHKAPLHSSGEVADLIFKVLIDRNSYSVRKGCLFAFICNNKNSIIIKICNDYIIVFDKFLAEKIKKLLNSYYFNNGKIINSFKIECQGAGSYKSKYYSPFELDRLVENKLKKSDEIFNLATTQRDWALQKYKLNKHFLLFSVFINGFLLTSLITILLT